MEDKKFTGLHKGDLEGIVLTGDGSPAQFTELRERLQTLGGSQYMPKVGRSIELLKRFTRVDFLPEHPTEADWTDDKELIRMWYEEEIKVAAESYTTYTTDMKKIYAVAYGQVDDGIKLKLKSSDKWEMINEMECPVELLKLLRDICYQGNKTTVHPPTNILRSIRKLVCSRQRQLDGSTYVKTIVQQSDVLDAIGGDLLCPALIKYELERNKSKYNGMVYSDYKDLSNDDSRKAHIDRSAKQQLLAAIIIEGSSEENSILKETLENHFVLGEDNYPSTTTEALGMLNDFKGSRKGTARGNNNNKQKRKQTGGKNHHEASVLATKEEVTSPGATEPEPRNTTPAMASTGSNERRPVIKIKITSFDQDGIRSGRSLLAVLGELGIGESGAPSQSGVGPGAPPPRNSPPEEEQIDRVLQLCLLGFGTTEKAGLAVALVRRFPLWQKISFEKTSGRCVGLVLREAVSRARVLEVRQHQRYDGIRWDFGIPLAADPPPPLKELRLTAVRFRGGNELRFLESLADGLAATRAATTTATATTADETTETDADADPASAKVSRLEVLELHSCRFLRPGDQYPLLFGGLKRAFGGERASTLRRLWMPKCSGLDDERMEELCSGVLVRQREKEVGSTDEATQAGSGNSRSNLRELGFSYNECGPRGSRAIASLLAGGAHPIEVLYLNRQQGELDLGGIIEAAAVCGRGIRCSNNNNNNDENEKGDRTDPVRLVLNLSQNYVSSADRLESLKQLAGDLFSTVSVKLERMTFEVPLEVLPGGNHNPTRADDPGGRKDPKKNYKDHVDLLSEEEVAKLNIACGRVKYVLGRAASNAGQSGTETASLASSDADKNAKETTDVATGAGTTPGHNHNLDCILPDLLTILRLQEKQKKHQQEQQQQLELAENETNAAVRPSQNQRRQYQHWLPTFLRKSVKGNIDLLRSVLLPPREGPPAPPPEEDDTGDAPAPLVSAEESERLEALWREIEKLHSSIAMADPRNRGNPHNPRASDKPARKTNGKKHANPQASMAPGDNPLVRAAYDALPLAIPPAVLESEEGSPCLALPVSPPREESTVRLLPPEFIDTAEELSRLRHNLSPRSPPYRTPRMVAVDSEWYYKATTENDRDPGPTKKKSKFRTMSVATLQIAYVDENTEDTKGGKNGTGASTFSPRLWSFVIDLLSEKKGFQEAAREFVVWMFASRSCDLLVLGFAFGGDLRQLRNYTGLPSRKLAPLETVESRCLDVQRLLSSWSEVRSGRVPGLKKCAERYFRKPLTKDDQCSDWKERPLRPSQLEYAALDAVILLVLLSEKRREDNYESAVATAATTPSTPTGKS